MYCSILRESCDGGVEVLGATLDVDDGDGVDVDGVVTVVAFACDKSLACFFINFFH